MSETRTQPRLPPGTRFGGRFAPTRHSEADVALFRPAGRREESKPPAAAVDPADLRPPQQIPNEAILHPRIHVERNRDGGCESVSCPRCGADIEDYNQQPAIDAGADLCDPFDSPVATGLV